MKFVCTQHVPFEPPGNIQRWTRERGDELTVLPMYADCAIPHQSDFDALIVLGGPMSVNDDLPWLVDEKELVRTTIRADKPVLGICLGAQMIAQVLGGTVKPMGYREIGFFPIELLPDAARTSRCFRDIPETFTALHWHGETFSIPDKGRLLASSQACKHQAFEYGPALGLQFHLEMAATYLSDMGENCAAEVQAGGMYVQTIESMQEALMRSGEQPYQLLGRVLENRVG